MTKKEIASLRARIGRLLKKMSAAELAVKLKISVPTLYRWRKGDVKRPMRSLMASLDGLG